MGLSENFPNVLIYLKQAVNFFVEVKTVENLAHQFLFFYELDIGDSLRELVYTYKSLNITPAEQECSGFFYCRGLIRKRKTG